VTGFFSTHKLTVRAMRVACPGNLAALKPPLVPLVKKKKKKKTALASPFEQVQLQT